MGNELTTDGKHPPSSRLTSELFSSPTSKAFSHEVLHHMSSTQLNAAEKMQEGASPTGVTAVTPQWDVMQQAAPTQPSSTCDGNPPSPTDADGIGDHQLLNESSSPPAMADSFRDFLNELREKRREHQSNLEERLTKMFKEAYVSMDTRLEKMQESFQSQVISLVENSPTEVMIEENSEILESTQATILSEDLESNDDFTAFTNAEKMRLDSTTANHNLVIDSTLEKMEMPRSITANKVKEIEGVVQLVKNSQSTATTSLSELTIQQVVLVQANLHNKDGLAGMSSELEDTDSSQIVKSSPSSENSHYAVLPHAVSQHLLMAYNMYDGGCTVYELNLNLLQRIPSRFFQSFALERELWTRFHYASDALQKLGRKYFHLGTGLYTVQQISSQCDFFKALLSVSGWTCLMTFFLHEWLIILASGLSNQTINAQGSESKRELKEDFTLFQELHIVMRFIRASLHRMASVLSVFKSLHFMDQQSTTHMECK